jgi:hypothetical protein
MLIFATVRILNENTHRPRCSALLSYSRRASRLVRVNRLVSVTLTTSTLSTVFISLDNHTQILWNVTASMSRDMLMYVCSLLYSISQTYPSSVTNGSFPFVNISTKLRSKLCYV